MTTMHLPPDALARQRMLAAVSSRIGRKTSEVGKQSQESTRTEETDYKAEPTSRLS